MKCPICELQLSQQVPSFCTRCAWDLKNDLTLNTFLSPIPEKDFADYRERLDVAKKNWEYSQNKKKAGQRANKIFSGGKLLIDPFRLYQVSPKSKQNILQGKTPNKSVPPKSGKPNVAKKEMSKQQKVTQQKTPQKPTQQNLEYSQNKKKVDQTQPGKQGSKPAKGFFNQLVEFLLPDSKKIQQPSASNNGKRSHVVISPGSVNNKKLIQQNIKQKSTQQPVPKQQPKKKKSPQQKAPQKSTQQQVSKRQFPNRINHQSFGYSEIIDWKEYSTKKSERIASITLRGLTNQEKEILNLSNSRSKKLGKMIKKFKIPLTKENLFIALKTNPVNSTSLYKTKDSAYFLLKFRNYIPQILPMSDMDAKKWLLDQGFVTILRKHFPDAIKEA